MGGEFGSMENREDYRRPTVDWPCRGLDEACSTLYRIVLRCRAAGICQCSRQPTLGCQYVATHHDALPRSRLREGAQPPRGTRKGTENPRGAFLSVLEFGGLRSAKVDILTMCILARGGAVRRGWVGCGEWILRKVSEQDD